MKFLSIEFKDLQYISENLQRYAGKYKVVNHDFTCKMICEDGILYFHELFRYPAKLVPVSKNEFEILATHHTLPFTEDKDGKLISMIVDISCVHEGEVINIQRFDEIEERLNEVIKCF